MAEIISNAAHTNVDTTIGYIVTDTKVTGNFVNVVATNGASRAENVWNSYLRDTAKFIPPYAGESASFSPEPSPSCNAPDYKATGVQAETINITSPNRLGEAAFYYALEQYASELLRLRIGNIGADPTSAVAEMVVAKAMAMIGIAAERLAAFEKYCQTEAGIIGNQYQEMLSFAAKAPDATVDMAAGFWFMNPTDGMTDANLEALETSPADAAHAFDYIGIGSLGIGMQFLGANILQRKLGYSGARNPELAAYYQNAGKAMADQGTETVAKFVQFSLVERPQHAMSYLGL